MNGKNWRRQTSAINEHYGFPSAIICVEVKEQTGMHIWDNQRKSTDERQHDMEETCARMS
jgi:hypothetical protein